MCNMISSVLNGITESLITNEVYGGNEPIICFLDGAMIKLIKLNEKKMFLSPSWTNRKDNGK